METFQERLEAAFSYASMAEIARRLDIAHPTVQNYFKGRLPAPEVLIKIANETNVSLNWLLTGRGKKDIETPKPSFDEMFDDKIRAIVREEWREIQLQALKREAENDPIITNFDAIYDADEKMIDLGNIDEFNIEESFDKLKNPYAVIKEWYDFEGIEVNEITATEVFDGWETRKVEEIVDIISDYKELLDKIYKK